MPEPSPQTERILVDTTAGAEGGHAAIVAAAEASLQRRSTFDLLGDIAKISPLLQELPFEAEFLRTTHAPTPDDALRIACGALGGSTTTSLVSAAPPAEFAETLGARLSYLPGVRRSALAAVMPAAKGLDNDEDRYVVLVDAGALAKLDPADATAMIALAAPLALWFGKAPALLRVGLLTGDPDPRRQPGRVRRIHELLDSIEDDETQVSKSTRYHYVGPVCPEDVLVGAVDIVLTDGHSGSIFTRSLEGVFIAAESLVEREQRGFRGRIGLRILRSRLEKLRGYGDFESYGGLPLLGLTVPLVSMRADAGTRAWINGFRLCAKIRREELLEAQRNALVSLKLAPRDDRS